MTPGEARTAGAALARRTRKAQSLPKTIRDLEAIRRVVALLVRNHGDRTEGGGAA
jgi:hypothetical protein